jgi:SAM-dependent methyltransferase
VAGLVGAVRTRARMLTHAGRERSCSCCGARWRRFAAFNGRPNALCLRCGSLERHRALALHLEREELVPRTGDVLHFAPEPSLRRRLAPALGERYLTTDVDSAGVDVAAEISDLPLDADRFALVICSHVLEHVPDDRVALAELRRVLDRRGLLLVMVPRDRSLAHTDEDPAVTDPAERLRRFGQHDHVRCYGADLEQRLADAGFAVAVEVPAARVGADSARRHGLRHEDEVFLCRPAEGEATR